CGLRIGSPPAPVPSAGPLETQRQQVAIALERIHHAASEEDDAVSDTLADISHTYLEDLGGVWLPPPRDENPSPSSPAESDPAPDTLTAVTDGLKQVEEALDLGNSPNSQAFVSIWLTLKTAQETLSDNTSECTPPCLQSALPDSDAVDELSDDTLADITTDAPELATIYDALAYSQEIKAARLSPGEKQKRKATLAKDFRHLADLLEVSPTLDTQTPRHAAYQVDMDDLDHTQTLLLQQALEGWVVVAAQDSPERPVALDFLWRTYKALNPELELDSWPGLMHQSH
ncbi:MAG TPA: hypothetical protein VK054_00375, partial [Beutenbergiaceae bacterium]|nr:hypothetical protein [Beutenbergiaceae bacterium]